MDDVKEISFEQLKQRLEASESIVKAEFVIGEPNFGRVPVYFLTLDNGERLEAVQIDWTAELEVLLFRTYHVRMTERSDEKTRLGHMLFANLSQGESIWPSDFINDVFIDVLRERDAKYQLAPILGRLPYSNRSQQSNYTDCHYYLRSSVDGLQNSIVLELHYTDGAEAIELMKGAIKVCLSLRYPIQQE